MKEIGKERKIAIAALIVAVLMLTVAFAAMSRTLKINGTAKVDSASWDIRFTSANMTNKKGDAREVVEPVIDNGGINLTLKVGLRKPKDEITYEAVIENKGDIDAEIESIEYPTLTDDQAKIIEFVATYQNGDEISKSQEINAGEEKTVTLKIEKREFTSVDEEGNRDIFAKNFTVFAGFSQPDARSEELTGNKCVSAKVEI